MGIVVGLWTAWTTPGASLSVERRGQPRPSSTTSSTPEGAVSGRWGPSALRFDRSRPHVHGHPQGGPGPSPRSPARRPMCTTGRTSRGRTGVDAVRRSVMVRIVHTAPRSERVVHTVVHGVDSPVRRRIEGPAATSRRSDAARRPHGPFAVPAPLLLRPRQPPRAPPRPPASVDRRLAPATACRAARTSSACTSRRRAGRTGRRRAASRSRRRRARRTR